MARRWAYRETHASLWHGGPRGRCRSYERCDGPRPRRQIPIARCVRIADALVAPAHAAWPSRCPRTRRRAPRAGGSHSEPIGDPVRPREALPAGSRLLARAARCGGRMHCTRPGQLWWVEVATAAQGARRHTACADPVGDSRRGGGICGRGLDGPGRCGASSYRRGCGDGSARRTASCLGGSVLRWFGVRRLAWWPTSDRGDVNGRQRSPRKGIRGATGSARPNVVGSVARRREHVRLVASGDNGRYGAGAHGVLRTGGGRTRLLCPGRHGAD